MSAPETQITMRITPDDLKMFREVYALLARDAIVPPRESDLHRRIYSAGLREIRKLLPQESAPSDTPPDTDESL